MKDGCLKDREIDVDDDDDKDEAEAYGLLYVQ